jgi:hypothetical protein
VAELVDQFGIFHIALDEHLAFILLRKCTYSFHKHKGIQDSDTQMDMEKNTKFLF